jgi:hypothetical protein
MPWLIPWRYLSRTSRRQSAVEISLSLHRCNWVIVDVESDLAQMGAELEAVKKNIADQYAMADYLADHGPPEMQAHLHNVANAARQDIGSILIFL